MFKSFMEGAAYDKAVDKFNELAEKNIKTTDPYRQTLPDGSTRKLKLASNATKEEQKAWKKVQRRAWLDDKCFLGCYPVDCGCGLGPLVVILPVIGPYLMYAVHAKLIAMAVKNFDLDMETQAKLHANIIFDLLITLPPVIGSFFAWMHGCSTRNAALIHTKVSRQLNARARNEKLAENPPQNSYARAQLPPVPQSSKENEQYSRQPQNQRDRTVPKLPPRTRSSEVNQIPRQAKQKSEDQYYPSSDPNETYHDAEFKNRQSSLRGLRKPPPATLPQRPTNAWS
ncbi:DEKNAAC104744 [Brettanomyces naardenensis]|uniref:DEKNAAC104744 n=1 Tax=Brettanomyces naardenensis TaxID=13370 RepID=A0A448YQW8_BRENA|nr:DEKNAAC104744 [Brettanomyces naardenensis]